MTRRPSALIADDEPLLRKSLARLLGSTWPELEIVAFARNGREAIEKFDALQPDICFLDVHMPGLSGVEAAQKIGRRAHLVFVTAFDRYAVQAFQHGALDYLMKPVETARLADTVTRLQERLRTARPRPDTEELLEELAAHLRHRLRPSSDDPPTPVATGVMPADTPQTAAPLRWIRASVGPTLRLIPVDAIDYLRSDEKYTRIAWHDDSHKPADALVRVPLKELLAQLDPQQFAQVHRSTVVNLSAISHVTRGDNETADVYLKYRSETLPVSRSYLQLFRQM